ncbi:DUF4249 domain-containing protein [Hymenobacter edaphi]|nr:DUF4249 domain-containing protein [Hymenobacter edaphi]
MLSGCIDQISADLPLPAKQLVLNAILTPDSIFRVQVSRVAGVTDSATRLLDAAQVYLQAPGQPAEQLHRQGRGWYYTAARPRPGQPYTLTAAADGYPGVGATDTVPAPVPIQDAWYLYPTATDRNNELLGTVVLRFDDPAATANYYEVSLYQSAGERSGIPLDARGNPTLAAEDDAGFNPPSLVFSDQLFNGQRFELRAAFHPNGAGVRNGVPYAENPYLVLRSVSRAYYRYRKSWTRHLYNQGTKGDTNDLNQLLFLGDPSAMYTNVRGGYGVVVGYAKETLLLRPR